MSPERDLPLLHRLEQRRLHLGGRAVDLVGEQQVGEHRPLAGDELAGALLVDHRAGEVGRQQVRRELDARELQVEHLTEGVHRERLGEARDALDEHVAAAQQRDHHAVEHRALPHDDLLDLAQRGLHLERLGAHRFVEGHKIDFAAGHFRLPCGARLRLATGTDRRSFSNNRADRPCLGKYFEGNALSPRCDLPPAHLGCLFGARFRRRCGGRHVSLTPKAHRRVGTAAAARSWPAGAVVRRFRRVACETGWRVRAARVQPRFDLRSRSPLEMRPVRDWPDPLKRVQAERARWVNSDCARISEGGDSTSILTRYAATRCRRDAQSIPPLDPAPSPGARSSSLARGVAARPTVTSERASSPTRRRDPTPAWHDR